MASDVAIKKANHREVMENLDRGQKRQIRQSKAKHREEMSRIRDNHSINRQQAQQNHKNQLETMKQQNDTFVQQERLNHQSRLDKQKLQAQQDYQRAAQKKQRENAKLKHTAEIEKENYHAVKTQYAKKTHDKKTMNERQLQQMDQEGRFRVQQKKAQNREIEQSVQKHHNREMNRIQQRHQNELRKEKVDFANKDHAQKQAGQQKLRKNEQHFQHMQKKQHKHYHDKIKSDEAFFQEQIKSQRKDYTQRYQENEKINKGAFENQKNRYDEEIFKLRKNYMATAEFYDQRKEDPFYQLLDFGAKFEEGEAFYQVTAKVPDHEMKNVRVHVQPDKISLHANRMHEQEYRGGNEKIASNSAQSISQEFSMEKPAEHDQFVQTYKDGILTVTVPKKGYYRF